MKSSQRTTYITAFLYCSLKIIQNTAGTDLVCGCMNAVNIGKLKACMSTCTVTIEADYDPLYWILTYSGVYSLLGGTF